MQSNTEIAKAICQAYADKDRAAAERLIADDFHFTSPLDNAIDRKKYFEICWPNSNSIVGFDFKYVVEDGERVFVTYEGRGANGKHFRNTEIMIIRSGRIVAVEVYFGWNVPHEVAVGRHRDPQ